jgi:L-lactate dehydrogenase complex protein LldG
MSITYQQKSIVAKGNILGKLKKEVAGADYNKLPTETGYQYPTSSFEAQLSQFTTHLEANHAQVIKLKETDIAKVITEQLEQRNINKLLYGNSAPICAMLAGVGHSISKEVYDFDLQAHKNKLFNDMPAAITNSYAAIAATGSIVLWPTIEEPRTLSLVPPVHIVIVDAKKLYSNFTQLISAQQWQDKLPTNIVLVSGPSKTADIQQTLAYGAHGPKELIVLLLNS